MILQALHSLYMRKQEELPPEGFETKEIPFLIVINKTGDFVSLQDTRTKVGKKLIARKFLVPKEKVRSGLNAWKHANILWDHYGYVLGYPKSDSESDKSMALKQCESFKEIVRKLLEACPQNTNIKAINHFLNNNEAVRVLSCPEWNECRKIPGCNMSFVIDGNLRLVCEDDEIQLAVAGMGDEKENEENSEFNALPEAQGICLVTGEYAPIARLNPRTPIFGTKSNAKIVAFQRNMGFDSYGKEQSYNAPVSKSASFAYSTALNYLLAKESKQKIMVGDATTVFWAEKKHDFEGVFADLFGEPAKEDFTQDYKQLVATFRASQVGSKPELDPRTFFYVLGLAPNAARIAVRFWYEGTVRQVADHIHQHFDDCTIVHGPKQKDSLSLFRLLVSTAVKEKPENIPPNLAGEFMRSILAGTPYPRTLLAAVVRRIRAERDVTYPRAALVKAVLVRDTRYYHPNHKEVGMSLDTNNSNIGYRLGRLFAVLEKAQEEANPGINATIRDRFYGAASSTPVAVFSHLMKLKNFHLAKLDNRGRAVNMERLIGEIMSDINDFPSHLSLPDQGHFAVGYYHQRQDFFTKKENS